MKSQQLIAGDTALLNSGHFKVTILKVEGELAFCEWNDHQNKKMIEWIPTAELTKIDAATGKKYNPFDWDNLSTDQARNVFSAFTGHEVNNL